MNTIITTFEKVLFGNGPVLITLFVLGFYYVFFMLCFDLMDIAADIFDMIKYNVVKLFRIWLKKRGRALIISLWLYVKKVDKYKKFYNDESNL